MTNQTSAQAQLEVDDVKLTEALERLDSIRHLFTDRVRKCEISFWVGSAVSMKRYPDLSRLLERLFVELYKRIGDSKDPAHPALLMIGELIDLAEPTGVRPDPAKPVAEWDEEVRQEVLQKLKWKYSKVLEKSFMLNGEKQELAFDLLDIVRVYSDPAIPPDAEHRLLAILIREGVLKSVITTNWDPLIEKAHYEASGGQELATVVETQEILGIGAQSALIKIHGCAKKAAEDPSARKLMVATDEHIEAWLKSHNRRAIRNALYGAALRNGILYLGLSGQDVNLQRTHRTARMQAPTQEFSPPRTLFATGKIADDQRTILEHCYGPGVFKKNSRQILREAPVPLYAKPLLGGLACFVARDKLRFFVEDADGDLRRLWASEGLKLLFDMLRRSVDAIQDKDERWRYVAFRMAAISSSFLNFYRAAAALASDGIYQPTSPAAAPQGNTDQREMMVLLGVLLKGHLDGLWQLSLADNGPAPIVLRTKVGLEVPVFAICNNRRSSGLFPFKPGEEPKAWLVVNATGRPPESARPGMPGRFPKSRTRLAPRVDVYLECWLDHDDNLKRDEAKWGDAVLEAVRTQLHEEAFVNLGAT